MASHFTVAFGLRARRLQTCICAHILTLIILFLQKTQNNEAVSFLFQSPRDRSFSDIDKCCWYVVAELNRAKINAQC